ncbi:phosphomannomutase/phosphoglucomutase [Leptotrichia sp. OH3620_COT-345]|uniref:phosphomannomutase/phosphoglucomutase n=1 Tax=Leptotrichia sp. OH3620_COT-345 TaxID=2491048 RepID=UPI000F64D8B1|nr:phosphomannomutase/phosphoglucomutase [Leptotrichia sp. OH3620_COT-345]RRD40265.1 phosphomannomutase/phosphoglucomutase [Leptotrichia sp. OH3620_COT-345]
MELKHLVSGTDIRGIVSDFEDRKANLSAEEIKFIVKGFEKWIKRKYERKADEENRKIKVSVGYDARNTGSEFSEIIKKELKQEGIDVYDCKMSITPSLFMTTVFEDYKADGAIMITASHLPSYYNGLKFFTSDGGFEKSDVLEMLEMGKRKKCQCEENLKKAMGIKDKKGKIIEKNLADNYARYLCDFIRKETGGEKEPLKGLRVVIDAGNGAAGFFADKVIKELGGDITGSQFLNPDGNFPNHVPNPEAKEAIDSVKNTVLNNNADFGIIFDADGDRSAFVDKDGREINRNSLIALLSDILLKENQGVTIVTDSVTSIGLKKFIENRGGKHHRFQRGYKNVINEAKKLNKRGIYTPLAIETSGHAAFIDNYFLDDGAYMAARLLIQLIKSKKKGTNFTDILSDLTEPLEEKEIRFPINSQDFRESGNKVLKALPEYVQKIAGWELEKPNYEGVRVNCEKDGWFLLRLSLHEPLLCLNIETGEKGKISDIEKKLYEFLKNYDEIDLSFIK